MPVSFNNIPANWKNPLYWVEVDSSKAGLPVFKMPALLVGVKLAVGTAPPDVPIAVSSVAMADAAFGRGSQLAAMAKVFFLNNASQQVIALPVAEPAAGSIATGTITVATAPTQAGQIDLYIAGHNVPVGVAATDTVTMVALAIAAAVNANLDLPVVAPAPAAGVVTLNCRWKGSTGNDITMMDTYYSGAGGEILPLGLTLTYSTSGALATGSGTPVFTTAISNLGESEAEFVALAHTDSTTLLAWETQFGFGDTGRWGWMRQLYGSIFAAQRGTYASLLAFGLTRNSPQVSCMGVEVLSPSPVYEWAAAYCAKAARGFTNDPARPLQTLHMDGIMPAVGKNRFLLNELNALATGGIATQRTLSDNIPMISRDTTMYRLNLYGNTDDAYTDATTLATLAKLLRNQRQAITSKFPRHKIADDGTRFGPGQAIVTPKTVKAELVAQYRQDEFNGLVENGAAFKTNLIVERDNNDPTRLNVLYPPDLINGLRLFAVLAQFRLQYNRGTDLSFI